MKLFSLNSLLTVALVVSLSPALRAADPKTGDYKGAKKDSIPANSWGLYSYADAQKEAVKKKKPLTFLITDERADDAAVKKAGVKAFWGLEEESIVVVLRLSSSGEWTRLPEMVAKAAKSTSLGTDFPKLFVTTEDASTLLAGMTSAKIVDTPDKEFPKFGRELKKLDASKTASTEFPPPALDVVKPAVPVAAAKPADPKAPPAAPAPAPTPVVAGPVTIKEPKAESWTNVDGRAIQAALAEVNGEDITFLMADGRKIPYQINKLSPVSQKRVEELKAANAGK